MEPHECFAQIKIAKMEMKDQMNFHINNDFYNTVFWLSTIIYVFWFTLLHIKIKPKGKGTLALTSFMHGQIS